MQFTKYAKVRRGFVRFAELPTPLTWVESLQTSRPQSDAGQPRSPVSAPRRRSRLQRDAAGISAAELSVASPRLCPLDSSSCAQSRRAEPRIQHRTRPSPAHGAAGAGTRPRGTGSGDVAASGDPVAWEDKPCSRGFRASLLVIVFLSQRSKRSCVVTAVGEARSVLVGLIAGAAGAEGTGAQPARPPLPESRGRLCSPEDAPHVQQGSAGRFWKFFIWL